MSLFSGSLPHTSWRPLALVLLLTALVLAAIGASAPALAAPEESAGIVHPQVRYMHTATADNISGHYTLHGSSTA
jgi:hypothetical protein